MIRKNTTQKFDLSVKDRIKTGYVSITKSKPLKDPVKIRQFDLLNHFQFTSKYAGILEDAKTIIKVQSGFYRQSVLVNQ